MIELRIQPVIRSVASVAGDRKHGCNVVWIRCAFELRRVAGIAICRHGLELTVGHALVARVAIHGGVRSR